MEQMEIVVDTREQLPLWDGIQQGLKVGDYSIKGYEDKIAIERKSLADLFGTLGKGHPRFRKELEKAKELDYFAVVVEGSATDIAKKDFPQSFRCTMKGYVINKILFTLHMKYGVQFFFSNGRSDARLIIRNLFSAYLKKIGDEK